MFEYATSYWPAMPREPEFWSAIAGAIVGGVIAFAIQLISLRAAKRQREEDRRIVQQALGNSLLFKMTRIYSNFYGILRHFDECFENAESKGLKGEPWQIVLPLANLPDTVHFSSEEMGMLLAQKHDEVFNLVMSIDVIHNGLLSALASFNDHRMMLTQQLIPDRVEGTVLSGRLSDAQMLAHRPKMIEVNSLIEQIRAQAKNNLGEAGDALTRLQSVLREKLDLKYKLEVITNPKVI
jgi:hypothetical protein